MRRRRHKPEVEPLPVALEAAAESDPEEEAYVAELRRHVTAAVDELPPAQRKVLVLCFYQGLSHREAAEQLGEPLETVKSRIRMAMDKLKMALVNIGTTS